MITIKNRNHLSPKKFYDEVAPFYDTYFSSKKMIRQQSSLIKKLFKKNGRILDIGCGTGGLTLSLQPTKFKVVSLDKSSRMLKNFKKKLIREKLESPLIMADATKLPFNNDLFEYELCMFGIVNHLSRKSIPKLFKEINRVLKYGGRVIIDFAEPSTIRRVWNLKKVGKNSFVGTFNVGKKKVQTLIWLYDSEDILDMAKFVGLSVEKILTGYSQKEKNNKSAHRIVILGKNKIKK